MRNSVYKAPCLRWSKLLKTIFFIISTGLIITFSSQSFAENINKVSLEILQNIKGVGKNKAQKIIAERQRGGDYQNAADLRERVKGVGEKTITKMEQAGISFVPMTSPATLGNDNTAPAKPERKLRSKSRTQ